MESFEGKLAVVTGGGTGMGRELCQQLVRAGARVAMCDVSLTAMEETRALCIAAGAAAENVSVFLADVSDEQAMTAFAAHVTDAHDSDHIHLLFNNAGIGGAGSFVSDDRDLWEKTFAVCWYGVYYGCRAFLPLLMKADEGAVINTSSVNGFWASLGPGTAHTAYSAAKFAVKGFTEALITDFRLNAPHLFAVLVMPGHIGTSIAINSGAVLGQNAALDLTAEEVADLRERLIAAGLPVSNVPDDDLRQMMHQRALDFRDKAPTTAAQAATIILDGVRERRWRVLVGADAVHLDAQVRQDPESAYEPSFIQRIMEAGHMRPLTEATGSVPPAAD
ncbi:MAG: SDR family NAD(P)-dependent oxidoreductase [Pseudomonadota bacterium]